MKLYNNNNNIAYFVILIVKLFIYFIIALFIKSNFSLKIKQTNSSTNVSLKYNTTNFVFIDNQFTNSGKLCYKPFDNSNNLSYNICYDNTDNYKSWCYTDRLMINWDYCFLDSFDIKSDIRIQSKLSFKYITNNNLIESYKNNGILNEYKNEISVCLYMDYTNSNKINAKLNADTCYNLLNTNTPRYTIYFNWHNDSYITVTDKTQQKTLCLFSYEDPLMPEKLIKMNYRGYPILKDCPNKLIKNSNLFKWTLTKENKIKNIENNLCLNIEVVISNDISDAININSNNFSSYLINCNTKTTTLDNIINKNNNLKFNIDKFILIKIDELKSLNSNNNNNNNSLLEIEKISYENKLYNYIINKNLIISNNKLISSIKDNKKLLEFVKNIEFYDKLFYSKESNYLNNSLDVLKNIVYVRLFNSNSDIIGEYLTNNIKIDNNIIYICDTLKMFNDLSNNQYSNR